MERLDEFENVCSVLIDNFYLLCFTSMCLFLSDICDLVTIKIADVLSIMSSVVDICGSPLFGRFNLR